MLVMSGSDTDRVGYFPTRNKNEFITVSRINVPVCRFPGFVRFFVYGHETDNRIITTTSSNESWFVISLLVSRVEV